MEIEFLAQTGALLNGLPHGQPMPDVLTALASLGWLDSDEMQVLSDALGFQQHLQQIERIALEGPINPDALGAELRNVLVRAVEAESFDDLAAQLLQHQSRSADICEARHATPVDPET